MKHYLLFSLAWLSILFCNLTMAQNFDWQGHRGSRGLMPENSIPAFKKALDQGVTTLELDVVISKDQQVVVSHEPFFSADICLDSAGREISKKEEKNYNIFQYTYDQIKGFDCGSKGNARFPQQQKMKVYKPLLSEVFAEMEKYRKEKNLPTFAYNIEIKSMPETDGIFHPAPQQFSDLVYEVISEQADLSKITLQSFDFRVLKYWHQTYPKVRLAALVENKKTVEENLQQLGFTPQIYSPHYKLLPSKEEVDKIRNKGMMLIPWTVNEVESMRILKAWGVDGIITDYPDRAKAL